MKVLIHFATVAGLFSGCATNGSEQNCRAHPTSVGCAEIDHALGATSGADPDHPNGFTDPITGNIRCQGEGPQEQTQNAIVPKDHHLQGDYVEVPAFDASLGTLISAKVTAEILVRRDCRFESTTPSESTLVGEHAYRFSLNTEDAAIDVQEQVHVCTVAITAPADGTVDFAGPSGAVQSFEYQQVLGAEIVGANLTVFQGSAAHATVAIGAWVEVENTMTVYSGNGVAESTMDPEIAIAVTYHYQPACR